MCVFFADSSSTETILALDSERGWYLKRRVLRRQVQSEFQTELGGVKMVSRNKDLLSAIGGSFLATLLLGGILSLVVVAGTPKAGGVLRAAMATNPPTLDPHLSTTTATRQIAYYIGEGLLTYDEEYRIIPQLVESWEVSEDGLTYTFHLRDGVKFHNGKILTASDVKASWERYMKVSPGRGYFSSVKSIVVVDPLTLEVHQSTPGALEVSVALPNPPMVIFPQEIVENHEEELRGPDELIGTGPYKLVEWKPDVHILLKRFEDYTVDTRYKKATGLGGCRIAYFDQIEFIPVREAASRLAGLETGEYDYAEAIPITAYSRLKKNDKVIPHIVRPKWIVNVEINKALWPTSDVRFRQAVLAALDMEEIMKAVTFGDSNFYRLQPSLFPPEQTLWHNLNGEEVYNHQNLNRVHQLLDEVGYNNEPIIYITNRDFPWMYKASIAAAAQLQAAGINVQLEFMDWPSQMQRAISLENWHLHQCGWSLRIDPIMLAASFMSGSPVAYGYDNPEMDKLIEEIELRHSISERQEIVKQIQRLQWKDLPIINYGEYFELEATSSSLQGYSPWYVIPRFWNCWKE